MGKLLIPLVLTLLGTGAGVGAGLMLAPDPKADENADGQAETEAADAAGPTEGEADFVKLNNQFVVPVVRDDRVRSLIVLSLTLEVPFGMTAATYDMEPRLRDTFLQVMFDHANMGGFDGAFTQAGDLDLLRGALRAAADDVLAHKVRDVLITDIARQDM